MPFVLMIFQSVVRKCIVFELSFIQNGGIYSSSHRLEKTRTNEALVIRDVKKEEAGNYIYVATSAGVFDIETISYLEVKFKLVLEDLISQVKLEAVIEQRNKKA